MTGAEILKKVLEEEKSYRDPEKDHRQPRVSMVWACLRRQVAIALGLIKNDIDWYYCEAGYILQERAFARIKKMYPQTVQEVSVPTTSSGVYTHPDIYIPELGLCIQVKSGSEITASFGVMKGNHRDQVLLEWYFWIRAGHCLIIEKIDGVPTITRRIDGVPSSYEVLYIGREKYGETFVSIPVAYNPSLANALAERFEAVSEGIALGLLPKKLAKKKQECQWCGLNSSCW